MSIAMFLTLAASTNRGIMNDMTMQPELSDIPELPTSTDYLNVIQRIDQEFTHYGGTRDYIERYLARLMQAGEQYTDFFATLAAVGNFIEPLDRSTGDFVDEGKDTYHAFARGSSAGLIVVRDLHHGFVKARDVFSQLSIPDLTHEGDRFEVHHAIGTYLRELGDQGLALAGDTATDIVETWEEQVVDEVAYQKAFRTGLGIVALGAYNFHLFRTEEQYKLDFEQFRESVETQAETDWDTEASALFGNES